MSSQIAIQIDEFIASQITSIEGINKLKLRNLRIATAAEIPEAPERAPLPLKPRSVGALASTTTALGSASKVTISGGPTRTMTENTSAGSRFDALSTKERPKLSLQKRTLPLELPPYVPPPAGLDLSDELQRRRQKLAEKLRKEQEQQEREHKALEEIFASDDEDDSRRPRPRGDKDDDDSVWEQQKPMYADSSDSEED